MLTNNKNMDRRRKIIIGILIFLTGFLALTGMLGGIALVAQFNSPPTEQLNGSIFNNFTIPGIALAIMVGGSALSSAILLIRKNVFAPLFSILTGIIIMSFEFIEVIVIGSPIGIARNLQLFYFGIGITISILSISVLYIDMQERKVNL
jgi:hypothetical protein